MPLLVLVLILAIAPPVAADAPDGDASFSFPAAGFPVVELDGALAGGPLALTFSDDELGDVPVELTATLAQGADGKITGTAVLDDAPGGPVELDLTCDAKGKVRGKGLTTKLVVKISCDGEIDVGFGLRVGEATLKLTYAYDRVLAQTVRKASLRLVVLDLVSHRITRKDVIAGAPAFFPPALDWTIDVSIAPDPADPTGRRLLATATATLFGGAASVDFTGTGKYKAARDASSLKFKSDLVPGASFTLKKAIVDPAAATPADTFSGYELRYKIFGQSGRLVVAPPE